MTQIANDDVRLYFLGCVNRDIKSMIFGVGLAWLGGGRGRFGHVSTIITS